MTDVVSWPGLLRDIAALGTGLAAVVGGVIAALQYFKLTTHRDKVAAVRKSFESVVASLASENEVDRLAGAILLRRFFDPTAEVTTRGAPYVTEAVNVMAAILRGQPSGNFQKLLADGLAYAMSLRRADLQRTNLHNAYLGSRGERQVDLSYADFYRADLSGASLKGAMAIGAVFYQARMTDAVLRNADLSDANFFEADLRGVNFDGAKLSRATFEGARNIPEELQAHIKEGRWCGPETFSVQHRDKRSEPLAVYVSKPGCLDAHQEKIANTVLGWLEGSGVRAVVLERHDYPTVGAIGEIRRRMSGCAGAVVLGFGELNIAEASWRSGTSDEAELRGEALSTPWCHIEAGMAAMISLPLLLLAEAEVNKGVFDPSLVEHNVFRVTMPPDRQSASLANWLAAVRGRATSRVAAVSKPHAAAASTT
jgi:hypothetical protein